MLKVKKSGFTLVEVILACSMFAIVISGIILAINRSFVFMDNIKLTVRATNLAREGMEMMYSIRDTNWRKHSGQRDKLWLYLGEGEINNTGGSNDGNTSALFSPGIYVIKERRKNGNSYFYAVNLGISSSKDIEKFYSSDGFWENSDSFPNYRSAAKLTFTGEYSYYSGTDLITGNKIQDVMVGNGLEFYRIVRVFGVYKKDEPNSSTQITQAEKMRNGTPAEMRFCVKVFYVSQGKHSSEICGIMTNFMG